MRLKKRKRNTHKGNYGHVFVLAGSRGLTGAAVLCSKACLRTGAGLVTLGIPASLGHVMAKKLIEVMTISLPETKKGSLSIRAKKEILNTIDKSDVVVLGPGLSRDKETTVLIQKLIPVLKKPMVLDADALNAVSENIGLLKKITSPYIITPHHGEMSKLINKSVVYTSNNRINVAKSFANKYNAVVVLKGARTIVAGPKIKAPYINKTGNPGMATAGSGDVLTGVIGGFLAQGMKVFDAAKLAVYVHGKSGDIAAKEKGEAGLIASDILEMLPYAIKLITNN